MRVLWRLFYLILISVTAAHGANILAMFPHLGKSHFMMFKPLLEELAKKGHNLTVLSFFPRSERLPNYTDISLKGRVREIVDRLDISLFESSLPRVPLMDLAQLYWLLEGYEPILQLDLVKGLADRKGEFDLVITEQFNTDMFLGIAYKLQVPYMSLSSSPLMPWASARFANVDNPSYQAGIFFTGQNLDTFYNRLTNALGVWLCKLGYKLFYEPYSQKMAEKYLGELPPLAELAENTSLMLVNTHHSTHNSRPLVPSIIEVGGIHIRPPNKLPQEIETFLNRSKHGVIYFSMGSVMIGKTWPQEKSKMFLNVFSNLKENIIWKWDGGDLPNKPPNVLAVDWIEQLAVLGHPNVKLFISHGGLMSTLETAATGVPIVGIPVYGDQFLNVQNIENSKAGIRLDFNSLTESNLRTAIETILNEPTYKENALKLSKVFNDRPQTPLETAVYWTEYVIQNKGAHHLRSAGVNLAWYQVYLLDIILCVIFITVVFLLLFKMMIKLCLNLVSKPSPKKKEKRK